MLLKKPGIPLRLRDVEVASVSRQDFHHKMPFPGKILHQKKGHQLATSLFYKASGSGDLPGSFKGAMGKKGRMCLVEMSRIIRSFWYSVPWLMAKFPSFFPAMAP